MDSSSIFVSFPLQSPPKKTHGINPKEVISFKYMKSGYGSGYVIGVRYNFQTQGDSDAVTIVIILVKILRCW